MLQEFEDPFLTRQSSSTHKQRAGFFGDPVDELRMLDDPVEELLLSDGGTPRQVSLVVATVERDAEGKQTGPEESGPKGQLHC